MKRNTRTSTELIVDYFGKLSVDEQDGLLPLLHEVHEICVKRDNLRPKQVSLPVPPPLVQGAPV